MGGRGLQAREKVRVAQLLAPIFFRAAESNFGVLRGAFRSLRISWRADRGLAGAYPLPAPPRCATLDRIATPSDRWCTMTKREK